MTSFQETAQQSPWISVWLRPRLTIERIIAERQQRFVLLLTALGMIASLTSPLVGAGLTSQLFDWRVLLGLVFAGAALGMVALYAGVFVFNGLGASWEDTPPLLNCVRYSPGA
jgi:signal peptidase I